MKKYYYLILFLFTPLIFNAQNKEVEITSERTEKGYDFYANNEGFSTYLVKVEFTVIQNLVGAPSPRREIEVRRGRTKIFSLTQQNTNINPTFNYKYHYRKGRLVKKLNEEFVYLLPLKLKKMTKTGKLTYIGDQYGNQKEEDKPKDFYALSFTTEVGDTVYAARGGMVVEIEGRYEESGEDLRFRKNVNYVTISHKDGTFASYKLFQKNGILVQPGQSLEVGQAIGIIGGNHYESGSHLRFVIYYAHPEGNYAYIKPHFLTSEKKGILELNQIYTSIHSDEIITQEMNKRQLKKWKKKQSQ